MNLGQCQGNWSTQNVVKITVILKNISQSRKRESEPSIVPVLRSRTPVFSYAQNCLFCGLSDKYQGKKKNWKTTPVRTMDFQQNILASCSTRNDD